MFTTDKSLNFLDSILKLLKKEPKLQLSFEEIVQKLDLDKITDIKGWAGITLVNLDKADYEDYIDLSLALDYLITEKLIYKLPSGFRISYYGIMKIKTNSFSEEQRIKNWGTPKERTFLLIAVLSLLVALSSIFFSN